MTRADEKAREHDRLEKMILEGLRSPAREMTGKEWKQFRADLRRKATARTRSR